MLPNLLLLHGALGNKDQFKALVPVLEEKFTIHTLTFEGHGGVVLSGDFSMDAFATQTLRYIESNQLTPCTIFGYSMGGYVGLKTALLAPGSIDRIVTLGTKFDWTPESAAKEVKMLNPQVIEEKVPHFAQKLQLDHAPLDWKEVMAHTAQMMLDLGNKTALKQEDFEQIDIPVYLGLGDADTMVSRGETEQVSGWLSNGSMELLAETPHPIEKAQPETLYNFIIKQLR